MRATAVLVFVTTLFAAVNSQSGTIRLFNNGYSNGTTSGIVEVFYSGRWNTICQSSWGISEADVACQQLGYTGASSYSSSGASDYGDDSSTPLGISSVDCLSSSYLVLLQCNFNTGAGTCSSTGDQVTVTCYNTLLTDSPYTGMVRLQDGPYVSSGRAEVYCNGQWGTLCNIGFTSSVAETVCYQLGYTNYYAYVSGVNPGSSSQPIWLSNYYCSVQYSCVTACQTCPANSITSCQHSQDVSITCQYNPAYENYGATIDSCHFYWSAGAIVGLIFGVLGGIALCLCIFVGIPVCICCCLGIGIGSAAGGGRHHHYSTV